MRFDHLRSCGSQRRWLAMRSMSRLRSDMVSMDCGVLPATTEVDIVARAARGAVLRHAHDARNPIISGQHSDETALNRALLTVMPLPARPVTGALINGGDGALPGGLGGRDDSVCA
jgi:hypothetical protein